MKFSIIGINDANWDLVVGKSFQYDFYHTRCYHQLEENKNSRLFLAEVNSNFIAIPLIIRNIEETDFFDCTSAYGYCGPLSNLDFEEIPEELIIYFQTELINYFQKNKIVSAFSRLHPIIDGDIVFSDFGLIKEVNKTVAIDLKLTSEEQRRQYRKSNKSEINQLKGKKGFTVIEASSIEQIRAFTDIYHETMRRVNAGENYFFDYNYFSNFLKNECFSSKLLLAINNDEITAGAIFTVTKGIMQYHLAGTTEKYINETPMKLILDYARELGNKLKLEYLHLGGGVGGSDEDSLFKFKSGFSKQRFNYRIWQFIVDDEIYQSLCKIKLVNPDLESNYFPLYRSN